MAVPSIESVAREIAIIAGQATGQEPSAIDLNKRLDSQGVDSLGFAEFIFEVEEMFEVKLSDKDKVFEGLRTVNDLARFIVTKKSAVPV
ncbi:MAG: acyl carrier protein [Burkholderiales bacterium]